MEDKICGNCKNFRLHYIRYGKGDYRPLLYGHCVKPRLKSDVRPKPPAYIGKSANKKISLPMHKTSNGVQ